MDLVCVAKLPFAVHAVVATLAGLTFTFRPSRQLQPLTADSLLILQCYGGLILFTTLVALIFLRRPYDETTSEAALAYAFWHLWPSYRAVIRIRDDIGTKGDLGKTLGGPTVHLVAHLSLLIMFVASAILA